MIVQKLTNPSIPTFQETEEETQLILECAENILGHLNRLIEKDAQGKYVDHRNVLGRMISSCEHDLSQGIFNAKPSLS
ncbi:MAG: hypothetical protein GY816_02720 [Cytophagales bacterium]|nr:hypothetical protein [Cytophagales bacterium]